MVVYHKFAPMGAPGTPAARHCHNCDQPESAHRVRRQRPKVSPIERVGLALGKAGMPVGDVLGPEGCLELYIDGRPYHLTLTEMED